MPKLIKVFKGFPAAYPHFPENQISAKRSLAREFSSNKNFAEAKSLNRKIAAALDYYDLTAISKFDLPANAESLKRLREGFMTQNILPYTEKREGARRGYFDDPDSRWFGMTRPEAREIIIMELFAREDEGSAEVPTPKDRATSATQLDGVPDWVYPVGGLVLALGIGYGLHKVTSRGTNPR